VEKVRHNRKTFKERKHVDTEKRKENDEETKKYG
jgi:hypothetical protein